MGNATFTASLGSTDSISHSNWSDWTQCCQGSINNSFARVGAMLFSNLRASVKWAKVNISRITLTLTFDAAGADREKMLYMFRGTQTTLTGSGADMIGDSIGDVLVNGAAYNATRTVTFDVETNAEAFANLIAWLSEDESPILVLYHNETSEADSPSTYYLQISAATMEIEYTSSPVYIRSGESWVNAGVLVYSNGLWVDASVTGY